MGGHHSGSGGVPDGEQDDGDIAFGGPGEHLTEQGGLPDRLQDQREHPGVGQPERIVEIGGRGGDEFLAGRTARVNPMARRSLSIAENTEAEWVTRATGRAGSGSGSM